MTPVLAFDIETVPDVAGLRVLHGLGAELLDGEVAEMAFQLRRQATGSDFLPLHLHRVVAISCALRERESFRVWSLGEAGDGERELIQRFFDGIEKYTPQVVSWNGGGFDFPVLHYRGLIHGVTASRYWDMGEGDHRDSRDFKWNNYISRYHARHLDLMDLLALYQARANAPLDDLAQLMGLPGKIGLNGGEVWEAFQAGRLGDIRNYCEADVANTYLIFLRFQLMRGVLDARAWRAECELVRATLAKLPQPHWNEFLARWRVPEVQSR
jgi:predicted PolB exonuclease-like 3'-5' exonuclease